MCSSVSVLSNLQLTRHWQLLHPHSLPSAPPAPFPSWAGAAEAGSQPEWRHSERSCPSLLSCWERSVPAASALQGWPGTRSNCSMAGLNAELPQLCLPARGCGGKQFPLSCPSDMAKESNPALSGELHGLFDIYLLPGSLEEKFPHVHRGFCGRVFAVASWCIDYALGHQTVFKATFFC